MARKAQNEEAIRRIKEAIDNELTELNLSRLYLREIPSLLYKATSLRLLDLSHNKLSRLSPKFSKLRELNTLYLYNNWFEVLPRSVFNLTKLRVMSFALNKLEEIPEEIKNLKSLSCLYLNSNCIEVVNLNTIIELYKNGLCYIDLRDNLIVNHPQISNYGMKEIVDYYNNNTPLIRNRETLLHETKQAIDAFITDKNTITKDNIFFKVKACAKMISRYYQKRGMILTPAYSELAVFLLLGYEKDTIEAITPYTELCNPTASTISRLKSRIEQEILHTKIDDIYEFFINQKDSIIKN